MPFLAWRKAVSRKIPDFTKSRSYDPPGWRAFCKAPVFTCWA